MRTVSSCGSWWCIGLSALSHHPRFQGVLFRTDKFVAQIPNEQELLQNVKKYFFFFAEIAMQHYKFQARDATFRVLKRSFDCTDHTHSLTH